MAPRHSQKNLDPTAPCPFTMKLPYDFQQQAPTPQPAPSQDTYLLPTGWLKEDEATFSVVRPADIDFLHREMHMDRLDKIQNWYHVCSIEEPGLPYPLHRSRRYYGRMLDICCIEDINLHLLHDMENLYLKPIPLWLLDSDFWNTHLTTPLADPVKEQIRMQVLSSALGFLFSYCALICYPSDLRVAKENGLLPESMTWELWRTFADEIVRNHDRDKVHYRFWFGRLRLAYVQVVYAWLTYSWSWRTLSGAKKYDLNYSDAAGNIFYHYSFKILLAFLGYVVIALTAMQVGLGTDRLSNTSAFQSACWGFTIFSLVAPLAVIVFIVLSPLPGVGLVWLSKTMLRTPRLKRLHYF